ncbi:MAG: hypothetical protein FWH27_11300 [Planctomycetaceae bacterium]|nr:hypothetical protein [Planctomycetaceae bacterium]
MDHDAAKQRFLKQTAAEDSRRNNMAVSIATRSDSGRFSRNNATELATNVPGCHSQN